MKKTHGLKGSRTYSKWAGMKRRCYNPNEKAFKYYGAKGIKVCERWLNSFENFFADMGEAPKDMTLDRIDSAGDYSPTNCRWATVQQQASNKSNNRRIVYDGEERTLADWSRLTKTDHSTILYRLKAGWLMDQALGFESPPMKIRPKRWRYLEYNGVKKPLKQWCLETGIKQTTLLMRVDKYRWPIGRALGFVK